MSAVAHYSRRIPAMSEGRPQRGLLARLFMAAVAGSALLSGLAVLEMLAPAAQAAEMSYTARIQAAGMNSTARIQALLNSPVNGVVNLPAGTFTVRSGLRLSRGERIIGHHTTLRLAPGSGNYTAMLSGASGATDLSGLTITGVTFDQNSAGNPIRRVSGSPSNWPSAGWHPPAAWPTTTRSITWW